NVAAGAAVEGIRAEERASPVAVDGPLDAGVHALAGAARCILVDASTRPAVVGTGAAIVNVVLEIGADVTVRAAATKVAGATLARPASRQAAIPLSPLAFMAEGITQVCPAAGPGGTQSQRREHRAGEQEPQSPQRFATRDRLGERLTELVPFM